MFWQKLLEILHCLPIDPQNFESVHIKHYTGTEVILYLEKKYKWKIVGASFILAYAPKICSAPYFFVLQFKNRIMFSVLYLGIFWPQYLVSPIS